MITESNKSQSESNSRPSNEKIKKKILHNYRHSKQSQATRKSCWNYFFEEKYFGDDGHIFHINKRIIKDYND